MHSVPQTELKHTHTDTTAHTHAFTPGYTHPHMRTHTHEEPLDAPKLEAPNISFFRRALIICVIEANKSYLYQEMILVACIKKSSIITFVLKCLPGKKC